MEIRQLTTFCMVAETLNFTRAAEKLGLAQSSVSAQIKALERELGVMLFDRIGKQVFLTDAGNTLLAYAKKIEGMTEEIKSSIASEGATSGRLTIRMPESLASHYMPSVIEQYHQHYPDVQLNFINCSDYQLGRELNSGRIDIALLMSDDMTMDDVNIHYLKTEQLALVSSPHHPLCKQKNLRKTDLQNQLLLLPKTD